MIREMLTDLLENLPRSLREQSGIKLDLDLDWAPGIAFYDRNLIQKWPLPTPYKMRCVSHVVVLRLAQRQYPLDRLEFSCKTMVLVIRNQSSMIVMHIASITRNGIRRGLRLAHHYCSVCMRTMAYMARSYYRTAVALFQLFLP